MGKSLTDLHPPGSVETAVLAAKQVAVLLAEETLVTWHARVVMPSESSSALEREDETPQMGTAES